MGGSMFGGLFQGIGNLIELVSKMEREGTAVHRRERTVHGRTASGKEVRGVYGFSVRTGLGGSGRPRVEPFGNIRATKRGPVVAEVREPIVDVFEEADEVVVVAELPGVEESEITTRCTGTTLTIAAAHRGQKQYEKVVELPSAVRSESSKRSYRNGVLELRFRKGKIEKQ